MINDERLLLAERLTADVHLLSEAAKIFLGKDDKDTAKRYGVIANIVRDGLKINLENLKRHQILKRRKIEKIISVKNLIRNPEQLKKIYEKLIEELEAVDTSRKDKPTEISQTFQYVLVSNISGVPVERIGKLPITVFREILELAINWGNFLRGGNFEMLSSVDKRLKLIKEHQELFPEMWN